jgi:hypothetical protein
MRASRLYLVIVFALAACGKPDAPVPTTHPEEADAAPVSESDPGPGPQPGSSDPEAPLPDEEASSSGADPESDPQPAARAPGDPVSVPEDPAEGLTEPTSFANVKLEIKQGPKVHKDPGQTIRWDELTRIPIDVEGQIHEFLVHVTRAGENTEVMMSYNRAGNEILRKYTFDTKVKKREVLRIDDGTALAVTVTPLTVKPHKSSHKKVERVEGNDPLTGAKLGEPASTKNKKTKGK